VSLEGLLSDPAAATLTRDVEQRSDIIACKDALPVKRHEITDRFGWRYVLTQRQNLLMADPKKHI